MKQHKTLLWSQRWWQPRTWVRVTRRPLLVLLPLCLGAGWYGWHTVKVQTEDLLNQQLQAGLNASRYNLSQWMEERKSDAITWANSEPAHSAVAMLAYQNERRQQSTEDLMQSHEQDLLRRILGPICSIMDYQDFLVQNLSGRNIASLNDDVLGSMSNAPASFQQRILAGETLVSAPYRSANLLSNSHGILQRGIPTMVVATPVRSESGRVIGSLRFRINPLVQFNQVLENGRSGRTGEIYAFNRDGYMISASRFEANMVREKRLNNPPDQTAILAVHLHDPGNVNLKYPPMEPDLLPLTRMAEQALKGGSGVDVRGYRNYRGQHVVGAWTWLPQYEMGLAYEIESSEAYAPFYSFSRMLLILLGMLALATGISEWVYRRQRLAEAHLQQSERNYRLLFETNPTPVYRATFDGRILDCNQAFAALFGFKSVETVKTFNLYQLVHLHEPWQERVAELQTQKHLHNHEMICQRLGGESLILLESLSLAPDKNGEWTLMQGSLVDLTQMKQSEQARAQSELRFRKLFESSLIGFLFWDQNGHILDANDAFLQLLGLSRSELQSDRLNLNQLTPAEWLRVDEQKALELKTSGQCEPYEKEFLHHNGSRVPVLVAMSCWEGRNDSGPACIIDLSERKRQELALASLLRDLESMNKELESILYVTTHDLRSPLVNIQGFTHRLEKMYQRLEQDVASTAPFREIFTPDMLQRMQSALHFIKSSSVKMDNLINALLRFSRSGRLQLTPEMQDMNRHLQSILATVAIQIEQAEAEIQIDDLPPCFADSNQVNQVFSNLIDNALKYRDPERPLRIHVSASPQGYEIVYRVADTGLGIPEEHQAKVWELFHRLNPNDSTPGVGLGLATVKRMVERNHGRVWIESSPGVGSTFVVALPASAPPSLIPNHHNPQATGGWQVRTG